MTSQKKIYNTLIISLLQFVLLTSCEAQTDNPPHVEGDSAITISKVGDIPTPNGFERFLYDSLHVAHYLQNLSFKEDNTVYLYNGELKYNQRVQYAVQDIDEGHKDLKQCAVAHICQRDLHLFIMKHLEKRIVNFSSGALTRL